MKSQVLKTGGTLLLLLYPIGGAAQTRMTIPVQVQRPAEVTLPGISSLAIAEFDVAAGIDASIGANLARKLRASLAENGHYKLVEKDWTLKGLLSEYGYVRQFPEELSQLMSIFLGADGLCFGTVETYSSHDEGGPRTKETRAREGNIPVIGERKEYAMTREVEIHISCQILDGHTGSIVLELSQDAIEKDSSAQEIKQLLGSDITISDVVEKTKQVMDKEMSEEDKARNLAIQNLTPATVLFDRALDKLAENLTKSIAPHTSDETRTLEAGGHRLIVKGYDFAVLDLWDEAKEAWEGVLSDEKATKVHPRAWYNLGIYYELTGDVDNAEECFDKAYKLEEDDLYLNAKARIKKRKEELTKLERAKDVK